MKIIISEKQLQTVKKSLSEEKNPLDALNKYIKESLYITKYSTRVFLENIHLSGEINDVSIEAKVVKILENDTDVTEFAREWSITDSYTSEDLPLGYFIKMRLLRVFLI